MASAFQRFNRKVMAEGILKSIGLASIIGFSVMFVSAFICWMTGFEYAVVLSLCLGLAVIGGLTPLFYIRKFRPTAMKIAAKVDALGLKERLITMTELENDSSYIAMRQRQDALDKLAYVNEKYVKMHFSPRSIAAVSVAVVFGISMLTVSGLAASGLLPSFVDIVETAQAETLFAVDYEVEGEGIIEGDANQLVLLGDSTEIVIAVADDGWIFVGWDDGYEDPVRSDSDIQEDQVFIAIFQQLGQNGDGDGNPDGMPGEDSEDSEKSDEEGEEGEGSDGEQSDSEQEQDQSQPEDSDSQSPDDSEDNDDDSDPTDPNEEENNQATGKFVDNNKIIDDNIYYGDVLDQYRDWAMELLENDDSLTEEDKEMIRNYFGII